MVGSFVGRLQLMGQNGSQADCPPFCVAACFPQMVQIAEKAGIAGLLKRS